MYFFIQGTKTTPSALLNKGHMKIVGNYRPLEENGFYNYINKQVKKYAKRPENTTYVDISLNGVNASSKKNMVNFLATLENLKTNGFDVCVNWWIEKDNEDLIELGEIYNSMFDIEFRIAERKN